MAEKRYRVKSLNTGSVFSLPLHRIEDYVTATNMQTGGRLYEALDPLPGAVLSETGRMEQTLIPPERVYEAFSREGPLRVLTHEKDPLWEAARQSSAASAKERVAKERSSGEVFAESVLSGVTFGQSSRIANWAAGEGAAEARARSVDAHGMAHFGGQAVSLLLLGALPIPGLGALTVGAKTGLRAGTIFEAGGKAASIGRKAIQKMSKAKPPIVPGGAPQYGFLSELGQRIAGPVAFGGIVDAPLSAALVAADIVDRDKEFTAESFGADFMTQYMLSLGIATVTSVPLAALGAAARGIGQRGVRKSNALLGEQLPASIGQGVTRHVFRPHRSKSAIVDVAETHTRKLLTKALGKQPGQLASEHWLGRFVAGIEADEWINLNMLKREAVDGFANARTVGQYQKYGRPLLNILDDPGGEMIAGVQRVLDNAPAVVTAKRAAADMIMDGRRFGEQWQKTVLRHPPKAVSGPSTDAANILNRGLEAANLKPLKSGFGDYSKRLDHVLNARWKTDRVSRNAIYDAIYEAFPNMRERHLPALRTIDDASEELLGMAARYGDDATGFVDATKLIGMEGVEGGINIRNQIRAMDGPLRRMAGNKVRMVEDFGPFTSGDRPFYVRKGKEYHSLIDTRLNDMRPGLEILADANRTVAQLNINAKPLLKGATVQSNAEILGAQVGTVMTVKQRIAATLKYIQFKGGAIRHTGAFGGVFAFRDIKSAQEKRAVFAAYHDAITGIASTTEDVMEQVSEYIDPIARGDMQLGVSLAVNQAAALSYLSNQLPRSSDSQIAPEEFSTAEQGNFLEIVGALIDPLSVLASSGDGSTTEQGVDAIRTVYPALYEEMVLDVAEFVAEHGDDLSHEAWIGLDVFTGYALGYTDGPAPNLTLQPPYYQTAGQAQSAGAVGGPEHRRMDVMQNTTPAQKVGRL